MATANRDNTGSMDDVHGKADHLWLRPMGDIFLDTVLRFDSDLDQFGYFTHPTLAAFASMVDFGRCPLYALLHEPCYLRR